MKRERFAPIGALALNPKAFGIVFGVEERETETEVTEDGTALLRIDGPLMNQRDWCFDSYEEIKERMQAALDESPKRVLMVIDSPGGLVSGCFDTARELRSMCERANVPLHAHVESQATSAAYALASAATWIGASESAMIGSVGVIDQLEDVTERNRAMGLNVRLITSGERKADGNPLEPMTQEAIDAAQERVNSLAVMFFSLIVDHGWAVSSAQLAAMQAGILTGKDAVAAGLVTEVASLSQTLQTAPEQIGEATKVTAMSKMQEALDALRSMAKGEDEEEAKSAIAALAALGDEEEAKGEGDEEDAPEAEGDEDAPEAEGDEDAPEAEGDEDEPEAEGDEDEEEAKGTAAIAARALRKVARLEQRENKRALNAKRNRLIASRPDLSKDMIAVLKKAPLATVKDMIKTMPKSATRTEKAVSAATATGTRGDNNNNASRLPAAEKARLDARMGLTKFGSEIVETDTRLTFGVRKAMPMKGGN